MAKAKGKTAATTALIDVLVFVFDQGEVVSLGADEFIDSKGVLDLDEARAEAVDVIFEGSRSGAADPGPIDVYRITREVGLPVQPVVPIPMTEKDGPLITPPPKAKAKRRGA